MRLDAWLVLRCVAAILPAALGVMPAPAAEPAAWKFELAGGERAAGFTKVAADQVYSAERGFGFEPGARVTAAGGYCTSEQPFFFSVKVPEGNYRVTVTLGDPEGAATTNVKAELRRLMLENV